MEISTEKRFMLCKGLDSLIETKEIEIKEIQQRTEEDYSVAKIFEKFTEQSFSLEREKERDIQKVKKEISELRELRDDINSLKNHLLLVPTFIKLHLSSE